MRRGFGVWLVGAVAALLAVAAPATERASILAENPAIRALAAAHPEAADTMLTQIEALMALPLSRGLYVPPKDADSVDLLQHNPTLRDVYRRDRKATAKLLETLSEYE